MLMKWFSMVVLKMMGWRVDPSLPEGTQRSVMVAAPHTSNMDALLLILTNQVLRLKMRFAIKRSWTRPPLGWLLRAFGAVGVDRRPRTPGAERPSLTEAMAELFKKYDKITMVIAPEGTRKKVARWKTGFYRVAMKAKVPISLGYLDYKTKTAGVLGIFHPTGALEADIAAIQRLYRDIVGRHPERMSA